MKATNQKDLWLISNIIENKNYNFSKSEILKFLPEKLIDEAIKSISSWNSYSPTPLVRLDKLSSILGLKEIYYKDESKRFTLKSFKALGGAFAVEKVANGRKNITVATATAGNHGRSVAWGAQKLGLNCKIFISEYVSESRADAMREFGANVVRVKGNYDNSLKECIAQSQKNNWEIVQDTAWSGYELIPQYIMAGYTIMIKEIFRGEIEIKFGRENDLHHYEITPYNYKPQIAKKITPNTYYDLGQGLMDQIYDLKMNMDKDNGSKKVSLRKRKK